MANDPLANLSTDDLEAALAARRQEEDAAVDRLADRLAGAIADRLGIELPEAGEDDGDGEGGAGPRRHTQPRGQSGGGWASRLMGA